MNLKQDSSVQEYNLRYMEISQKLYSMPREYVIDCYLSGLREEIANCIRLRLPGSLTKAMSMAKVKEATYKSLMSSGHLNSAEPPLLPKPTNVKSGWQSNRTTSFRPSSSYASSSSANQGLIKQLDPASMDEKRKKGLCYTCEEKWEPNHICKSNLFMVSANDQEDMQDFQEPSREQV